MATITYSITDEKLNQLSELATAQKTSINNVIDELVTVAISEREAFLRFNARAGRGNPEKALEILKSKFDD